MDATLAARHELEVLDGIGDIDAVPRNAHFFESLIKDLTGRSDEGTTRQILLVARLFADEHDPGIRRSLAEHRLGRLLVERAATAGVDAGAHIVKRLKLLDLWRLFHDATQVPDRGLGGSALDHLLLHRFRVADQ